MYRVCDHHTDLPGTTEGNVMIEFAVDALLYILLLAAIGFGWISVIGLLLFPDIRSRAFTGIRAGIIAMTACYRVRDLLWPLYLDDKWRDAVHDAGSCRSPHACHRRCLKPGCGRRDLP